MLRNELELQENQLTTLVFYNCVKSFQSQIHIYRVYVGKRMFSNCAFEAHFICLFKASNKHPMHESSLIKLNRIHTLNALEILRQVNAAPTLLSDVINALETAPTL